MGITLRQWDAMVQAEREGVPIGKRRKARAAEILREQSDPESLADADNLER